MSSRTGALFAFVSILAPVVFGCGRGLSEPRRERRESLPADAGSGAGLLICDAPSPRSLTLTLAEAWDGQIACEAPLSPPNDAEACEIAKAYVVHSGQGRAIAQRSSQTRIGDRVGDAIATRGGELVVRRADGFRVYCYSLSAGGVHLQLAKIALY